MLHFYNHDHLPPTEGGNHSSILHDFNFIILKYYKSSIIYYITF